MSSQVAPNAGRRAQCKGSLKNPSEHSMKVGNAKCRISRNILAFGQPFYLQILQVICKFVPSHFRGRPCAASVTTDLLIGVLPRSVSVH